MELTVHKEIVVVGEIKAVELERNSTPRAQFIYDKL